MLWINVRHIYLFCDHRYTYKGSQKKMMHAYEGFRQGAENDCNGMTFPFAALPFEARSREFARCIVMLCRGPPNCVCISPAVWAT